MIFLDISRSKACLGAALAKSLIPTEHGSHRIVSIAKKFEHLCVNCECGEQLETTTTPDISELLNSSFGALETGLYSLEMEELCLAVHKQHPRHVPILASSDGTVRCSCGEEILINGALVVAPPQEKKPTHELNLSPRDSSTLCFYALAFDHLLIKYKQLEIIKWWVSDGLNGPMIRVETKKGVEDLDDRLLYSLALKVPEFKGKWVPYPKHLTKAILGFRELRLHHHYEHHITLLGVSSYGGSSVHARCSCGFSISRESRKMSEVIRQVLQQPAPALFGT